MIPDPELLRRFDRTNAEDAFAELVKRHVNLVYSAALRQVHGDEHAAKDVAQTVFSDLARKAGSLARRDSLTGWLYTSAHHAAAKIIRTETRRRDREEKFMREPTNEPAPAAEWENLRPMLDAAMHELKETDREAILLRYFENRPFAEVGAKLGLNENAARMRVERALEKLRLVFAKRGIAATSALAAVISANAVQLAPVGLSVTLTTASIAAAGTGTFTLLKIMTATKLKLGVSALVVAGTATALVVQQQNQTKLRDENGSLQQQIAQLQTDNESFSNRLATAGDVKKLPDDQFNELLKLRGEVGVLRTQLTNIVTLYAERVGQQSSQNIESNPYEQQFKMKSELAKVWVRALLAYVGQNQGQLPINLGQAASFLSDEAKANTNLVSDPFEIVYPDPSNGLTNGIIVREQQTWLRSGNMSGRVYAWIQNDGGRESFAFIDEGDQKALQKWKAQNAWEVNYEQQQQTALPSKR